MRVQGQEGTRAGAGAGENHEWSKANVTNALSDEDRSDRSDLLASLSFPADEQARRQQLSHSPHPLIQHKKSTPRQQHEKRHNE